MQSYLFSCFFISLLQHGCTKTNCKCCLWSVCLNIHIQHTGALVFQCFWVICHDANLKENQKPLFSKSVGLTVNKSRVANVEENQNALFSNYIALLLVVGFYTFRLLYQASQTFGVLSCQPPPPLFLVHPNLSLPSPLPALVQPHPPIPD